ncbi:BON domain-containing protein [Ensifer soli]|uniref:BON domain-containing protein n=1 Tax=Ciceribacter sp. sgz301302 TaxID=3342379 RepID=UPI0035BAD701
MADSERNSREDDYRDYDTRNIRDGWPYADGEGREGPKPNGPYGGSGRNLDQDADDGVIVAGDPELREVDGAPLPFPSEEAGTIADDDIEERIGILIEADDNIELSTVDIAVHAGKVILSGSVDSREDRARLLAMVKGVPGVRAVSDRLVTEGVDSHIPPDTDE